MFFPDKYKNVCLYVEPDYPYIHRELAKPGVTLTLLMGRILPQVLRKRPHAVHEYTVWR